MTGCTVTSNIKYTVTGKKAVLKTPKLGKPSVTKRTFWHKKLETEEAPDQTFIKLS